MTPDQIDTTIADLSIRLERVRSLYEQYFLGIERIEPSVARKAIERSFQELRKTRFPTTAKRFKFQTLIQRYNSLQQYWNKTCREIENGTYRKHRIKAKRKYDASEAAQNASLEKDEAQERAAAAVDAKDAAEASLTSMMDSEADLDAELGDALAAFDKPSPAPQKLGRSTTLNKLAKLGGTTPKIDSARKHTSPKLSLPKVKRSETGTEAGSGRRTTSPKPLGLSALKDRSAQSPGAPQKTSSLRKSTAQEKQLGPPPAPSRRPQPPAAPQQKAPPPRKATSATLSEDRIRALHASYSDARMKTNATAVSYEKLSKSIRDTEKKLRAKSKGRNVDFDVSIKDGKAILKPKLK